jgi:hypothetical protein
MSLLSCWWKMDNSGKGFAKLFIGKPNPVPIEQGGK